MVLATIVTIAMARWNRPSTTKTSASRIAPAANLTRMPGIRDTASRAKARASSASASATLIASTVPAASGSAGSAVIASRSGRCRRTSCFAALSCIGSGAGSYTPATRNARGLPPAESADKRTTVPVVMPNASASCREIRTSGIGGSAAPG
jgi:hypothetical protein